MRRKGARLTLGLLLARARRAVWPAEVDGDVLEAARRPKDG
jgi:hypothetical protein